MFVAGLYVSVHLGLHDDLEAQLREEPAAVQAHHEAHEFDLAGTSSSASHELQSTLMVDHLFDNALKYTPEEESVGLHLDLGRRAGLASSGPRRQSSTCPLPDSIRPRHSG